LSTAALQHPARGLVGIRRRAKTWCRVLLRHPLVCQGKVKEGLTGQLSESPVWHPPEDIQLASDFLPPQASGVASLPICWWLRQPWRPQHSAQDMVRIRRRADSGFARSFSTIRWCVKLRLRKG
jgi:hypothetical protein